MSETIIKTDNAVIRQQKVTILKEVSLQIKSGEFIYIIGKVGSGKSSFLKTLYAELPLEYGNIEVAGFQLKKIKKSQIPLLRRKCGIVFQDFKLLTDRNVYANLEFVLKATGWKNKKSIQERIDTVLEKVEMPDKKYKMPHELSGGEQQRIVLARALLNAPPLILADEPTGNIDPETSYRLVELLKELCENGKTVIIATHQYDLLQKYPGRVLRCENGTLTEDETRSVGPHTLAPADIESIENIPLETENEPQEENNPENISGNKLFAGSIGEQPSEIPDTGFSDEEEKAEEENVPDVTAGTENIPDDTAGEKLPPAAIPEEETPAPPRTNTLSPDLPPASPEKRMQAEETVPEKEEEKSSFSGFELIE